MLALSFDETHCGGSEVGFPAVINMDELDTVVVFVAEFLTWESIFLFPEAMMSEEDLFRS